MKCASCEAEMICNTCPYGCDQTVDECLQVIEHQIHDIRHTIEAHRASLHDLNMIREGLSELASSLGASLSDFDTGTDADGFDV